MSTGEVASFKVTTDDGGEVEFTLNSYGHMYTVCDDGSGYTCQESQMNYEQVNALYRWLEVNKDLMEDSPAMQR